MAVYLRSRPRSFLQTSAPACSSLRFHFSSSSSSSPDSDDGRARNNGSTQSESRSSFIDVKSKLQNREWQSSRQPPQRQAFSFNQGTSKSSSIPVDDIRKNLAVFRSQYSAPPPSGVQEQQISFQSLYKRTAENENAGAHGQSDSSGDKAKVMANTFASIRGHLKQMNPSGTDRPHLSLSKLKDSLNLKPKLNDSNLPGSQAIDGKDGNYFSFFGKELSENAQKSQGSVAVSKNELVKYYTPEELGEKLRKLRPQGMKQGEGEDSFSLSELNERLIKLREMDLKAGDPKAVKFRDIRSTIQTLEISKNMSDSKRSIQRISILNGLDGTPTYMLEPPKEHLVETYFHPDNMSSAEKLKLELKKVRDEFKMSETDCGSTRVQIAQLTTEILHLSKTLHKKDKHSRKGLHAKVQLRKKLLKYLRRTDWDSYCFILSKLGLRDNPGYKQ